MSVPREQRSRQACEPCRRKKSKCPGERPVCSFCQRLNVQCIYLPREYSKGHGRVPKTSSKDRFRALETQVDDIYQIIHSLSNRDVSGPHEVMTVGRESREDLLTEMTNTPPRLQNTPTTLSSFTPTYPEPPIEVLDHLVDAYRERIHLQPLPLFNLGGQRARLAASPQFLRWSFLSLTLDLSSHEFYRGRESDAIQFYARCAEDSVTRLAAEGKPSLDVIMSLCLLALKDLIGQQPARAWMKIGTASRLQTMRILAPNDYCDEYAGEDMSSRCYWSVFILETALSPQVLDFSVAHEALHYPLSAPWPPPLPTHRDEICPPDLHSTDEGIKDLGINAYSIKMISIWGKLTLYLRKIRAGHIEIPWSPESTHTSLTVKLYEYDTQLAQKHLLRNVCFSKRSTTEILQQQEYWRPWITMQVLSHAIPAILNHPFIHLVAMRGNCGAHQSRLFLQQIVDMALFNSGWVFRLIQTCEDLQFEINDPLIAHAVAATATIPWLFQFTRDSKVSKKAYEDLGRCERFLSRISGMWPHISRKLEILQRLQSIARDNLQNIPGGSTMISFQPQMFWELLDPKICQMAQGDTGAYGGASHSGNVPVARMRVTTHFVHPLIEDQEEQPSPTNNAGSAVYSFSPRPEDLEQVCLDQIFYHFSRDEPYWLQV